MKKFKEILLLKNLKRVGNAAINGKYNKILTDAEDIDDLINKISETESKFSDEDLQAAKTKAEEVYEYVINSDAEVITVFDDEYPKKLDVMKNSKPAILYVKGNTDALNRSNIAVIGTREPSQSSQEFEENLVKNIVNSTNNVVVSGLALGCDKIAHKTTVDEGKTTIAILPSWVDSVTPTTNKGLAEEILETGGCLVSEYGPDSKVYKSNYLNRDKIVAAFSDAILVVECGAKSGTMHTVDAAKKFNRRIYVYLPDEIPEGSYDGNIDILAKNRDAIKVEDIDEFISSLENTETKKQKTSVQQTF